MKEKKMEKIHQKEILLAQSLSELRERKKNLKGEGKMDDDWKKYYNIMFYLCYILSMN